MRPVVIVNVIIVVLEIIALIHDCMVFGPALIKWYTIDSNVLQMGVSALIVYYCMKGREISGRITALHFILSPQKTPASTGGEMNAVFVNIS